MGNTFLKLAVIGGVGYLWYKYYYLPAQIQKQKDKENEEPVFPNDGRTAFYGDSKSDYVRGFPLPENINDIKSNTIFVISKPKINIFNQTPRTMMEVSLLKDVNRIVYFDKTKPDWEKFIVDYKEVKDKLVMNQDYTKNE